MSIYVVVPRFHEQFAELRKQAGTVDGRAETADAGLVSTNETLR